MSGKVRKTLTLDPEIVEAFGQDAAALSATVNGILRDELERRQRRRALGRYVDALVDEFGEPDPADVERFRAALTDSS